ncbi:hypothetical protein IAU60_002177 [Kwoniella sp. DSM 27419]
MKYLLDFLDDIPGAPKLSDPEFAQLLQDVQAGKNSSKAATDRFHEDLEKLVNEIKASPESVAFQRPVSKRDAPDYYDVIKKPMDLTTILKNVKGRKYKTKDELARDLNLIWDNCYEYNSSDSHPLRAAARLLKQKADYHLGLIKDKNERQFNPLQSLLSHASVGSPLPGAGLPRSPSRNGDGLAGADEDAAGESDDAQGEDGEGEGEDTAGAANGPEGGEASRSKRGQSVASTSRMNGRPGSGRVASPPVFRPQLNTSLETAPALLRTPYTMTHYLPVSLSQAGPSFSDKGKAKEILYGTAPPPWYPLPAGVDDEDVKLEGYWWGAMTSDEAMVSGLPSVPEMVRPVGNKCRHVRPASTPNGHGPVASPVPVQAQASAKRKRPKKLRKLVHRTVDQLHESRQLIHRIQEFQRIEAEGGMLPSREIETAKERMIREDERKERAEGRRVEKKNIDVRRKEGGEVAAEEATLAMKQASAGLLAHAGFEGANEAALDLFTRVAVDHLHNIGRTFRLLVDGFSNKMTAEEITLHALHENGQIATQDLESHLKDEVEREGAKVAEMQRKIRQAFKEAMTAPVIQDDMMFGNDGEMLVDGNFADELGEDFLGLRDLGIDKEFGLSSLTVPSALFYGRKKRAVDAGLEGLKDSSLEYPPPPKFVPLVPSAIPTILPALLHAFYATRMEAGVTVTEDDPFDPSHAQIGSLGQIVVKGPPAANAASKKKRDREGDVVEGDDEESKRKKAAAAAAAKKPIQPGVGKGNWVRPSKEEKARRAAEKAAGDDSGPLLGPVNGSAETPTPGLAVAAN